MTATIDQLSDLLQRIRKTDNLESLKQEAKVLLSTLEPCDRVLAEQQFAEAGLAPEDLRHTCFSRMSGLFGDAANQLKQSLPPGHVIRVMIEEHDRILGFLDNLETLNQTIQRQGCITGFELQALESIATNLLNAEPHHQREENVLFPNVEQCGLIGPPEVMRHEHEELRARKQALLKLAQTGTQLTTQEFKGKLNVIAGFLTLTLRDHIMKENNILYPASLQAIKDTNTWERMQQECDRIGYCDFT